MVFQNWPLQYIQITPFYTVNIRKKCISTTSKELYMYTKSTIYIYTMCYLTNIFSLSNNHVNKTKSFQIMANSPKMHQQFLAVLLPTSKTMSTSSKLSHSSRHLHRKWLRQRKNDEHVTSVSTIATKTDSIRT